MIYVSPLSLVETVIADHAPSHMITLLSPGTMIATPRGVAPNNHLKIEVHDIGAAIDGHVHPAAEHVAQVLTFVEGWDPKAPILVHCWAGVSRSTASAFMTMCKLAPDVPEEAHARRLRAAAPHAAPNPLLVRHADAALGRNGRMIAAVEAMGMAEPALEGVIFKVGFSDDA